ncbi:ArgP/LysG family DNA-binding transcriptional regulator [Aeromicrobium sp. Leaf350]|uniref:ArgP/LysG family DNA-binding transcriptional regulator n=1 Tax=Aeromicrobium sp. Leaf350 TaxID=2876565 RepID=UPI001E2CF05B|nr:ArgP/LysG family DNA-binding transcriptional regulator [Aeromicrobium sp. Leaf350]
MDALLALTLAAVADEGTLDGAARRLHLTPSAVSQRVKTLEDQVGHRLLVRSRPVRVTEAGEAVVRFARRYEVLAHEASAQLGAAAPSARTRITVAVNADSLATWLLAPVARFTEAHDVEVEMVRLDQDRTVDLLESGAALAAVTSQGAPVNGCRSTPLGHMAFHAMAAPGWVERWAPTGIDAAALSRAPRVDYDRDDTLQLEWLRHHGIDGHDAPRHFVPSTHDIARAVELGLGWALVPARQARDLEAEERLVPLGGPVVTTPLFWQAWKGGSSLLASLTDEIVAEARRELQPA